MSGLGRRALVIGFGRSGQASARYLRDHGIEVLVQDRADTPALREAMARLGVNGRLGGYAEADLNGIDLVVVSPGVPWDLPLVESARRRGIRITSEIDLFFQVTASRIVGITGTNGKSTTTGLAADVLRAGGLRVHRGGNIGEPVLDRVDRFTGDDWAVLELSSFQLESITRPRLHVGAILNVTPDHLDRHGTFDRYRDIKARAIRFMEAEDRAVLNRDDPVTWAMRGETAGRILPFSTRHPEMVDAVVSADGWVRVGETRVLKAEDIPLPGEHNLSNVLAAVAIGSAAGVTPGQMAAAVRAFAGLEHRLELVGEVAGVRWYNDSKATTPDSTLRALEAFTEPIVLIAGGRNKGIDVGPLAAAIARRASALVAIGETGPELVDRVRAAGLSEAALASDLEDAVSRAADAARPGSVVLLSPAFASYDMFQDFEDRGRRFKAAVRRRVNR
ncbi:MAG TPA: UDP-N-acetylmuramoyl-L-alanine--D-glutamate ligase [Candidatus Limnocylindrales bacterium]|nr:UDP-N-acetylmuramoyl-L-alanine--D-glutamate ligase [Candidatus Limnocylindrales bacterium]